MALATKALDGVFRLGGSTVDSGMLVQSTGGLTNFPTLVAGKEWHGRSRCPGRAAHKIERRFRGCEM